jgi:hypothetical protein
VLIPHEPLARMWLTATLGLQLKHILSTPVCKLCFHMLITTASITGSGKRGGTGVR